MDHKKINKKEAPSGMLPSHLEGGTKQSTESEGPGWDGERDGKRGERSGIEYDRKEAHRARGMN